MSGLGTGLLLGGVHGVVLAGALLRRAHNRSANRYLAALLGALSMLLLDGSLRASGVQTAHPHLIGLAAWVPFLLGPLVFLYVRQMTAPVERAPWRHFVIASLYVVVLIATFYPRSASYKLDVALRGGSWIVWATGLALIVHGLAYALAALVLLRRHPAHVQDFYSNMRGVSLRWLLVLAWLNALVWISALASFVLRATGVTGASAASAIVPIGSTITIFVIGYFQLVQTEIVVSPASPAAPPEPAPAPQPEALPEASKAVPYQKARLPDEDAAELEARIVAAMTDRRLYQRAGLTLADLADEVAATPHELSQVLSTRLQRNFYTFVNEHRIEHVKVGLMATDRPVLDLAYEAGFQSKSTFNSAFRKATGMTPSELRQRVTA